MILYIILFTPMKWSKEQREKSKRKLNGKTMKLYKTSSSPTTISTNCSIATVFEEEGVLESINLKYRSRKLKKS